MSGSPYLTLSRELQEGKVVVLDGGTGTELERRGAKMHGSAWCAMATLTNPDLLRTIDDSTSPFFVGSARYAPSWLRAKVVSDSNCSYKVAGSTVA